MELTYSDLRCKEVIDATCARRLGRVIDILFCFPENRIIGIVVCGHKKGIFSRNEDLLIKWHCIKKIGEDTILVETEKREHERHERKKHEEFIE